MLSAKWPPWHEARSGTPSPTPWQGTRGAGVRPGVKCEWPSLEMLFLDRGCGVCGLKGL